MVGWLAVFFGVGGRGVLASKIENRQQYISEHCSMNATQMNIQTYLALVVLALLSDQFTQVRVNIENCRKKSILCSHMGKGLISLFRPSCLSPLFQSESSCEAFHMKISFIHV